MSDLTADEAMEEFAADVERAMNEINKIMLSGPGMTIVLGAYYKVILAGLDEKNRTLIEACAVAVAKRIEAVGRGEVQA